MNPSPKIAYLTIDDGPTAAMGNKSAYLLAHGIPAVFFCTGTAIERYPESVVVAIQQGFVVGNHGYDHPHFSSLPLPQCLEQIRRTDGLLNTMYARAGVARTAKYFRFPYGDKGALTGYDARAQPGVEGAARKAAIQQCLRELGYTLPRFPGVTYDYWRSAMAKDADWYWTYDVMEWSIFATVPQYGVTSIEHVFARMDEVAPQEGRGLNSPGSEEIILLHDHPETDALFAPIVDRLLDKGLKFALPEAPR